MDRTGQSSDTASITAAPRFSTLDIKEGRIVRICNVGTVILMLMPLASPGCGDERQSAANNDGAAVNSPPAGLRTNLIEGLEKDGVTGACWTREGMICITDLGELIRLDTDTWHVAKRVQLDVK